MKAGFISFLADGGALCVFGLFSVILFGIRLTACTPSSAPPAPPDVVIVITDASLGSPCAAADAITQEGLIRDPDGGMPLVVPCPK